MLLALAALPARLRILVTRALVRLGFRDDSFLLLLAVLIGVITAAAAVGFHALIHAIRDHLYGGLGPAIDLYGKGILALIALPALGGLAVGVISRFVFQAREGHGIIDVMDSVIRSNGIIRPLSAIEKIFTSGITIGSGGSAGAEGPIVQIGAGIASGIGQIFQIARPHMPVLIGCGCAAGISAIFNSPIGGVFFTLEVILLDFSIRTFMPLVLASVIANVTTKAIFTAFTADPYQAIFALKPWEISGHSELSWAHLPNFVLLGLLCGVVGVALTRSMHWSERLFGRIAIPRWLKPGLGGAMLGVTGVMYIVGFGWGLLNQPKPIDFQQYPMPAFFSDGYGVIKQLVSAGPREGHGPVGAPGALGVPPPQPSPGVPGAGEGRPVTGAPGARAAGFYSQLTPKVLLLLLGSLVLIKIAATCFTLSSGGAGGIIAPSLFLGAVAGGFLGLILRMAGADVQPNLYALVGMGAVLAAVVHAPLASILILLDLTHDFKIILPAMLASVIATGLARLLFRDSIYTAALRARGVRVGTSSDLSLLRRMTVEQVDLEPAVVVRPSDRFQRILDLADQTGAGNFIVSDETGAYLGMIAAGDIKTALLQHEVVPLLLAEDLLRVDVPLVGIADDLAGVLDAFARHDVDHLPVCVSRESGRVIGFISRAGLMRRYQRALSETG